jgi:hypothetical protein
MHQLLLFVGTKLPIAMVGPQIILAMGENSRSRQSKRRCILQSSMVLGSGEARAFRIAFQIFFGVRADDYVWLTR